VKLSNVRLLATDYAAVFRFYRDVIGLQPTWGDETSGYADFNVGEGVGLALFDRREMISAIGAEAVASEGSGTDRVALVFGVDDLEAAAARLREHGISLVSEPAQRPDWGIKTLHLRDPEGNLVEVFTPMPREQWTENLQSEAEKYER